MKRTVVKWALFILYLFSAHAVWATFQELPLVVLICSYNNAPWVEQNLDSIFAQTYHNFRVLYIDDCSTDGTPVAVEQYIKKHGLEDRLLLIRNGTRQRKLKNVYNGIYLCDDYEIIVQVDGDDWLTRTDVFSEINCQYRQHDIWLTYGQFIYWPHNWKGWGHNIIKKITDGTVKRSDYVFTHPKSFYAWLAKLVKLQDLIVEQPKGVQGQLYPVANDAALMIPLFEMAGQRFKFIQRPAYAVNCKNPISTSHRSKKEKKLQVTCYKEICRNPQRYQTLSEPVIGRLEQYDTAKAVMVMIGAKTSDFSTFIQQTYHDIKGLAASVVLCDKIDQAIACNNTTCFTINGQWQAVKNYIEHCDQNHILIVFENVTIQKPIDCTAHITLLEKTFADMIFEQCSMLNNNFLQHIEDDMYALKYRFMKHSDRGKQSMVLCRKEKFLRVFDAQTYHSTKALTDAWSKQSYDSHAIALLCET